MNAVLEVEKNVGAHSACEALGIPKTSYYRALQPNPPGLSQAEDFKHHRALSDEEQAQVLKCLNSERFMDKSPAEAYATLLDEGTYHCSLSTMYRILRDNAQVKERRNQLSHPNYTRPELLATGPNQVWSWDITKLLGPAKWSYFYLYVIMDIFSRYVVGWMVAHRESSELAKRLIKDTLEKQEIEPGKLFIHADRGPSMTSKPVGLLLSDLGVTKTHSRPHVSNDNPFSESHFKTLKYRPEFPSRFGCIEDARAFCEVFFHWYSWEHHHSGIGLLTPGSLHYGQAALIREQRQKALDAAFLSHPERFVRKPPVPPEPPQAVWINPPKQSPRIAKKLEYFVTHQERMAYASFKQRNIPMGSGAMESCIRRLVNLRFKGNGIFWKPETVEGRMHLRAQLLSRKWPLYIPKILGPKTFWESKKPVECELQEAA